MASVTTLVTQACELVGFNDAAADPDRVRMLRYLNQAYQQAVVETRGNVVTLSVANVVGDDVTLASLGISRFAGFRTLTAGSVKLVASTEERIRTLRLDSAQPVITAGIVEYAVGGNRLLMLYPTQTDLDVAGSYYQAAPVLVESAPATGEEATPTALDASFHEDLLVEYAVWLAFRYKRDYDDAREAKQNYLDAVERYKRYVKRTAGGMIPSTGVVGYGAPSRDFLP